MKFVPCRFRRWIFVALLLTGGSISIALSAFAGLSDHMKRAINTAYMNGYVAALKMDIQQIEEIKSDNALMKKIVRDAARKYVQIVEQMN